MAITLSKGQKVSLTKGNPGLKHIVVGLGWDTNKYDGGFDFDLDSAAFLLDVCTLKYNEAKEKWAKMEENEKKSAKEKLKIMLKFIKKYALYSILDKEIYWKTRVMYLILK